MGFEDFNYSGFNQHILVDQEIRKETKRSLKARDLNELQNYNLMVSTPTAAQQSVLLQNQSVMISD